jgi:hypothetical protein
LRAELQSDKKDKNFTRKKIALKKIVANMTMSNNDMAALFPDVIQCMMIPALEVKKMYARSVMILVIDNGVPWGLMCRDLEFGPG